MAKTIKFNLICDGQPVRTIEDLQENFSVEDMLGYFESGLLLRWLKVRDYKDEYKEVSEISTKDDLEIAKKLIKIFNVETDEKEIAKDVYMLQFLKERSQKISKYDSNRLEIDEIVKDYTKEYADLVKEIMDNSDDISRIKANITEIVNNYKPVLQLNYRELFWKMADRDYLLVIMCFLMNSVTRKYYLDAGQPENDKKNMDTTIKKDKEEIYKKICSYFEPSADIYKSTEDDIVKVLGDNVSVFDGKTDEYWKDLEVKGKKYMILGIGTRDKVRAAGDHNGDLSYDDVNNKFPIVDGIDYMSNSTTSKLMYMEV
ncbi:hypothetical protein [Limosilactobacillus mucosae]|uniref:hypothetical protein n=1 Tax=Limosilactobacillus mucosae TaxID=97478 RepID=UPI0022E4814B|nr:hypothetical protein [Limosilactobacillus mucosae]